MYVDTLEDIKVQVEQLAKLINAPKDMLPTYGTSRRDGTPHVEIVEEIYYYIAYDRDTTSMNRKTYELQELLYWIFENLTSLMGYAYGRIHRKPKVDSRRLAFSHQLELLEKLNLEWKEKRQQEIEEILRSHPYRDKTF